MNPARSRRFCGTIYHPNHRMEDDDEKAWLEATRARITDGEFLSLHGIRYVVMGLEKGEEEQRWHLQFYLETNRPRLKVGLKAWHSTAHFIVANGSAADNRAYCTKSGDFVEWGEPVRQGQRTDLETLGRAIIAADDFKRLALEYPSQYLRYGRNMERLHALSHQAPRRPQPHVYRCDGPPGIGKSYSTFSHLDYMVETKQINGYVVITESDVGWFDGYTNEDAIVFEDFAGRMPLTLMLKLIDFNPFRASIKGSSVPITASHFFFTSNSPLEDFYQHQQHDAWLRRIRRGQPHVHEVPLIQPPPVNVRAALRFAPPAAGPVPNDAVVPSSPGAARPAGHHQPPSAGRAAPPPVGCRGPPRVVGSSRVVAPPPQRRDAAGPRVLAGVLAGRPVRTSAAQPLVIEDSDSESDSASDASTQILSPATPVQAPRRDRVSSSAAAAADRLRRPFVPPAPLPRGDLVDRAIHAASSFAGVRRLSFDATPEHLESRSRKRRAHDELERPNYKRLKYFVDDHAYCSEPGDDDDDDEDWEDPYSE